MPRLTIILPTCGRPTLKAALDSVLPQLVPGDELLVVGDGPQPAGRTLLASLDDFPSPNVRYFEHGPTGFYGNAQRNFAQERAAGDLLMFLDDDDDLCPGALASVRGAAQEHPGRPLMFRLRCDDPPFVIWDRPILKAGNISGGAFVAPNDPARLGRWPTPKTRRRGCSDVTFIEDTLALHPPGALVWRTELIYHVPRRSRNAA